MGRSKMVQFTLFCFIFMVLFVSVGAKKCFCRIVTYEGPDYAPKKFELTNEIVNEVIPRNPGTQCNDTNIICYFCCAQKAQIYGGYDHNLYHKHYFTEDDKTLANLVW